MISLEGTGRNWTLIQFLPRSEDDVMAYRTAWQLTDDQDNLVGLYDDDGEQIQVGNRQWIALEDNLIPPWL